MLRDCCQISFTVTLSNKYLTKWLLKIYSVCTSLRKAVQELASVVVLGLGPLRSWDVLEDKFWVLGRAWLVICQTNNTATMLTRNSRYRKMTARCAQYVSALKIVGLCKRKINRRLRKNLHITILSLFGGAAKLFSKYSIQCDHGTYIVT